MRVAYCIPYGRSPSEINATKEPTARKSISRYTPNASVIVTGSLAGCCSCAVSRDSNTIYLTSRVVRFGDISQFFLGGITRPLPAQKDLILNVGVVVAEWLLLYFLYKKRVFLRV